jgi:hypothetical protein
MTDLTIDREEFGHVVEMLRNPIRHGTLSPLSLGMHSMGRVTGILRPPARRARDPEGAGWLSAVVEGNWNPDLVLDQGKIGKAFPVTAPVDLPARIQRIE